MVIRFKDKRKGYALIISVGVLSMLVIIAIAFVINMRLELRTAENYDASVKCKYLADAAIAKAVAELKYGIDGAINNAVDDTTEDWHDDNRDWDADNIDLGDSFIGSYAVTKIIDCASQININDDTNPNLNDMLTTLNSALGSPLTAGDITQIVNNAPYETEEEILGSLGGNLSQRKAKYDAIKDYITIFGDEDPNTVNPQDITNPPYETQARVPINVNTAPREVLIAVLSGIRVDNACPRCGGDGYIRGAYAGHYGCPACGGTWKPRIDGSGDLEITATEAGNLADYIITNRPYRTWSQFYSSIKSCASIGEEDADLVMANCNPDTGFSWIRNVAWHEDLGYIGKYVVDMDRNGSVSSFDKGLTNSSTEFSFNSGGYYEIYTEAQVTDAFSNIVAEKKLTAVVKIFDIYHETTQEQFDAVGSSKSNVQSYPEPAGVGISSANYSGQLAISTLWHNQPANPPFTIYFRANYLTTLNADPSGSGGNPSLVNAPGKPTMGSVASSSNRGELLPDGMLVSYLDSIRPKYWPVDNASADEGTFIIWFKPRYPGNDSVNYSASGVEDQDRKMCRFTSNTDIYGNLNTMGSVPYFMFFFWSDHNRLYSAGMRGGGRWDGSQWNFRSNWWSGVNSSRFPKWKAGEWTQLAISWKNPDDEFDPIQYNSTDNPIALYANGNLKLTNVYYYHTPYGDRWGPGADDRVMHIAHEHGSWWGSMELSSAVIGNVKIYPERLSDIQIADSYFIDGVYRQNGTFESSTFDPTDVDDVEWGAISWTEAIPSAGGDLVFNIDAGSGWQGNFNDPSSGNPISSTSSSIRYRVSFSSGTKIDTPILSDIAITYLRPTEIKYWREIYE